MFVVIRTGGKQYKVQAKDQLEVPTLDAKEGDNVDVEVLITSDGKGITMAKNGAKLKAKVIEHTKAPKIVVFKKKRRQNYRRTKGHKQGLTRIEIADIKAA